MHEVGLGAGVAIEKELEDLAGPGRGAPETAVGVAHRVSKPQTFSISVEQDSSIGRKLLTRS
jgi:hypothetical protein